MDNGKTIGLDEVGLCLSQGGGREYLYADPIVGLVGCWITFA